LKKYHGKEEGREGVKWILKGDSNNEYFHGVANGRKKTCAIFSMEEGGREIGPH
jgi:hypothetical protein